MKWFLNESKRESSIPLELHNPLELTLLGSLSLCGLLFAIVVWKPLVCVKEFIDGKLDRFSKLHAALYSALNWRSCCKNNINL